MKRSTAQPDVHDLGSWTTKSPESLTATRQSETLPHITELGLKSSITEEIILPPKRKEGELATTPEGHNVGKLRSIRSALSWVATRILGIVPPKLTEPNPVEPTLHIVEVVPPEGLLEDQRPTGDTDPSEAPRLGWEVPEPQHPVTPDNWPTYPHSNDINW